ncbi:MAG TPA: plastocyanin/azurin family copper-binding protein [Bacteroidales bacterium]|nr:plastocyanin/azurin family copper-binding protein [Bacteroidales bacterium]
MKKKAGIFRMGGVILLSIVVITLYEGCTKKSSDNTSTSGPGANEVWMQNTAFNPVSKTVAVNTTITWINKDSFAHDVTADDSSFYSGDIPAGGTYTHQFKVAGTYNYKCLIHPGMNGQIIVQ